MAEQWLSIVEYARLNNVSDMTVRRRIKTGKLQAVLREGKYYIPVRGVAAQPRTQPMATPSHGMANQPTLRMQETPYELTKQQRPSMSCSSQGTETFSQQSGSYQISSFGNAQNAPASNGQAGSSPLSSNHYSQIPAHLAEPLSQQGELSINAHTLLRFCNEVLKRIDEQNVAIKAQYQEQIDKLEAQLKGKATEIKALQQQVEDLQVLVKILEKKRPLES